MTATTSAARSLWLDPATAGPTPEYPRLTGMLTADVCVVGGGIAGLTCALLLARDGARVVVLEADRVGTGVSGCTTGKLSVLQSSMLSTVRSRHGDDATRDYAEAARRGVNLAAELADEHVIDCDLHRADAVTFAMSPDETETVEAEYEAARIAGVDVRRVQADLPFPEHGAIGLADQVALHPLRYVRGLADAVTGLGGTIHERSRVLGVREGHVGEVRTAHGTVRARDVVIATHVPILDRGLYFPRLPTAQR